MQEHAGPCQCKIKSSWVKPFVGGFILCAVINFMILFATQTNTEQNYSHNRENRAHASQFIPEGNRFEGKGSNVYSDPSSKSIKIDKNNFAKARREILRLEADQIVCGVLTWAAKLATRGIPLFQTWASDLNQNKLYFYLDPDVEVVNENMTDDEIEATKKMNFVTIHPREGEKYIREGSWKVFPALKHMYEKWPDAIWYLLVDDDTFMFVPNLLAHLHTFEDNMDSPAYVGMSVTQPFTYVGEPLDEKITVVCIQGGGGIVLNQVAMSRANPKLDECIENQHQSYGDVRLGACLRANHDEIHIGTNRSVSFCSVSATQWFYPDLHSSGNQVCQIGKRHFTSFHEYRHFTSFRESYAASVSAVEKPRACAADLKLFLTKPEQDWDNLGEV